LSGTYNVHTGKSDINKIGSIELYNDLNYNPYYQGECSKLHGSTGELFSPTRQRDSIDVFIADIYRTLTLDYEKDVMVNNILGFKYLAGKRVIDNGTNYAENLCFNNDKYPSGVMNISASRYSSPVFMSYPHFFEADEYYLQNVDGMNPNRDKHQSYITLEPVS
jgi:hypothetical protein